MKSLLGNLGVILIGLALFTYGEVWGADWKLFAETDLFECFYDAEGITPSPTNILDVWAKLEYTKKGVTGIIEKYGKYYEDLSYSLELFEINCTEKRERILSITEYSVDGKILYVNSVQGHLPAWKRIPRGSVDESLYKTVCKWMKKEVKPINHNRPMKLIKRKEVNGGKAKEWEPKAEYTRNLGG
jgi:hypothetical protein